MNNQNIPETKKQKQIAVKIPLGLILTGTYIIGQEQEPNYLKISSNTDEKNLETAKIYRANIIAVVINKEKIGMITNLLLEDSTGKITARLFEENKYFPTVEAGEVVQIIGKIRVYNEEKYISPEILKKSDPLWLKVRSKEIKKQIDIFLQKISDEEGNISSEEIVQDYAKAGDVKEKNNEKNKDEKMDELPNELTYEKILKLIKELDQGSGVFIEEVLEKSSLNETETIIQKMLENGDIFQNQPGKVKVL